MVFSIEEIVELYSIVGARMAALIDVHNVDNPAHEAIEAEYALLKGIREKVTDIRLYAEGELERKTIDQTP